MRDRIHIGELHMLARAMKYDEFTTYLAKELEGIPESVDSSAYTNELYLYPPPETKDAKYDCDDCNSYPCSFTASVKFTKEEYGHCGWHSERGSFMRGKPLK
jgi:hypothetical protein